MRRYFGFFVGCIFGAVVTSLACWSSWTRLHAEGEYTPLGTVDRQFQDRYVTRVLDFAHLALMLRTIEPELESEWIEDTLFRHAQELNAEFRQSRIVGHAMKMITGYYVKNNLPIPSEIEQMQKSMADDPAIGASHSEWLTTAAFNERLAEFDAFIAARRAWEELQPPKSSPAAGSDPHGRVNSWGSAVSF
jgi:hypothetical protein